MSAQRRIDGKGRVTLPSEIREQLGLDAGSAVTVDVSDGAVVIHPDVDREELARRLEGCIDEDTRASDAPGLDPGDLKDDWTSDLP